jgi:hypothetical protein
MEYDRECLRRQLSRSNESIDCTGISTCLQLAFVKSLVRKLEDGIMGSVVLDKFDDADGAKKNKSTSRFSFGSYVRGTMALFLVVQISIHEPF